MRPVGPPESSSHTDCVLIVGVSRPKLAALFLSVMLISLFLTFHILYDSAIYSIQVMYIFSCFHLMCVCVCVEVRVSKGTLLGIGLGVLLCTKDARKKKN